MKHHWETVEEGNWHTKYQCTLCKESFVEELDKPELKPNDGCIGSGEKHKMSYRCLWGVTIKQDDGKYHVVDENGTVMAKFSEVHRAYKHISITEEAWIHDGE